jgi:uncharacterized OsmC-like protein
MPDMKFGVAAESQNKTKTVVRARGFTLTIDEPESLGGADAGANPVEYLLAALCGCLTVVGHLVAGEMNMPLKGLKMEMEGDLNPDKFAGRPSQDRAGFKQVRVTLQPDAGADAETLEKWMRSIEERCPVSDNIGNATPLIFKLGQVK